MSLVTASVVRDERGRFWDRALEVWSTFSDELVVLDDGSTDGTREAAEDAGAHVLTTDAATEMWGNEAPARRRLFEMAWDVARVDDYILWLDADMTPARDPRVLMDAGADGVVFRLFDLWDVNPLRFREDSFWRGHLHGRLWMVRKTPQRVDEFEWTTRGIHSGHLPQNFKCESYAYAPEDFSLMHYAYLTPELREAKYISYAKVSEDLTDFERAHARSILDPEPNLKELPFEPTLSLI